MSTPTMFQLPQSTEKQEKAVSSINAALQRLGNRRRLIIEVDGPLAKSKLAWKLAVLQQAALYRMVMLGSGTAIACNTESILTAFLSARALTETFAFIHDFESQMTNLMKKKDLGGIDALLTNRLFASRDDELLAQAPETMAVNVQTLISRLDRLVPGLAQHYNGMSERCHPNSLGHRQFFSELDRETGSVKFSDSKDFDRNIDYVLTSAFLLCICENAMDSLDKAIHELAEM